MPERFFVTGTDTGVGKTIVSALLCAALDATYWKPIQTGSREGMDRRTVVAAAALNRHQTMPETYCFAPPVSPHLAARRARVSISISKIASALQPIRGNLIVEGAGGVLVPLSDSRLMIDLMRALRLPVLLVARTSLGTINHTLLSLAALRAQALEVRGVIMVGEPNRENRKAIARYGKVRIIGTIPQLDEINRRVLREVFRKHFQRRFFFS
jgi:dethiobiotin synthetase